MNKLVTVTYSIEEVLKRMEDKLNNTHFELCQKIDQELEKRGISTIYLDLELNLEHYQKCKVVVDACNLFRKTESFSVEFDYEGYIYSILANNIMFHIFLTKKLIKLSEREIQSTSWLVTDGNLDPQWELDIFKKKNWTAKIEGLIDLME